MTEIRASQPSTESKTKILAIASAERPWRFRDGRQIGPVEIAYETFGELNEDKSNAILVFHALSGSHHAAGRDPIGPGTTFWNDECHVGWWDDFIGPGKAIDTNRYFIICCNYVGGCYGSTGPATLDPNGNPWGSRFPWVTISDIVDTQLAVVARLGIKRLLAVCGSSMGGFCAMDLAVRFPDKVRAVIPIASGLRATVLAKCLNLEQIFAIQEDPNYNGGDYYAGPKPNTGLMLARMISHKTFVSLGVLQARARKEIAQPTDFLADYTLTHSIESYMLHQGRKFVQRFDANSYLRIVAAWQNFNLPVEHGGGDAVKALSKCKGQHWLLFSIDSDVCFYPDEQDEIANALKASGIEHRHLTVHSEKGHDSFLLEPDLFAPQLAFTLQQVAASA